MFDEIFKRWINTGQLTENDIVPLFLEWNKIFGNGTATPQDVMLLINMVHTDYAPILQRILRDVGIKKGYEWAELYDQNGKFIARFWQKDPDKND